MVFRSGAVYLLVAVLLACPYPCLLRATAYMEASAIGTCRANDSCCPSPGSKTGKDHPSAPVSCPEGGTCLCHGAVMDRHVEMPNPDHAVVTSLPPDAMVLVGEPFHLDNGFSTERTACHFPAAESGREVRALIASLLL